MIIKESQYIYPPRPSTVVPRSEVNFFAEMGYIAQLKYNDSRAMIKYCTGWMDDPKKIELWNRHAERFRSYNLPDQLLDQLQILGHTLGLNNETWSLLDGGLLDQKHHAIKDTLVIWDILVKNGEHLLGSTYSTRYETLRSISCMEQPWIYQHTSHGPIDFGIKVNTDIILPKCYTGAEWDGLWNTVDTVNKPFTAGKTIKPLLEGIVMKNPAGTLEFGYSEKNNGDWLVRSRVMTGRHNF